jgi:serine/threonine-protein kinase
MQLSVGDKLGPYEILARLGEGGMGEVWKAHDTRLNRPVAIKRLKGRHSARFEQEARVIAALNHPNICQIYDIGPDYLVLEYIEGKSLHGPLAAGDAVSVAIQIAGALEAAHAKGILHRDLKPGNVILTAAGPKLLDFGLAKLKADGDSETTQTIEGTVLGTAAYMSPEQAQAQQLDERSDIFSLGAVLYEMFSGRRAFPGEHALTTLGAVIHKDPEPLQAPPEICRIVTKCLRKSPGERYQRVREVRSALASARLSEKDSSEQPSIAVLPFANMRGDKEQEYFSDGLAEEIINALVKIPGLKVIARTSAFAFKGQNTDIRKIAETLGVAHVLEGSVRRSGNRIRVTAQLVTAADGSHLWSERYDRELADVFEVQDEIAVSIAKALQTKLTPQAPSRPRYTPKLAAHEALLKARHLHWTLTPESMTHADEFYREAIGIDPDYALAHAAYSDYLIGRVVTGLKTVHEAVPIARVEAQKALELDQSLPEAYAMLGIIAATYEFDWKAADQHCRRALSDAALSPWMRAAISNFFLLPAGRSMEAVEQDELALQQDPLHPGIRSALANSLTFQGRFAEAEAHLRQVLDLHPNNFPALYGLATIYTVRGMYRDALSLIRQIPPWVVLWAPAPGLLAGLLVRVGEKDQAETMLRPFALGETPLPRRQCWPSTPSLAMSIKPRSGRRKL